MIDKVSVPFKYREQEILDELFDYLAGTYKSHYVGDDNVQAMDLIISSGHGVGFTVGDIIKYGARYGKKKGQERTDILKIIHYAIFLLYIHDKNEERKAREAMLQKAAPKVVYKDEAKFGKGYDDPVVAKVADQKGFLPPPTDLPTGLIQAAENWKEGKKEDFAPINAGAASLTKCDPVAKTYVESKKPVLGPDPVTALENEYGSSR